MYPLHSSYRDTASVFVRFCPWRNSQQVGGWHPLQPQHSVVKKEEQQAQAGQEFMGSLCSEEGKGTISILLADGGTAQVRREGKALLAVLILLFRIFWGVCHPAPK